MAMEEDVSNDVLLVLVASIIVWGGLGIAIARWKWRSPWLGFALGALLGGIGVLVFVLWPRGGWRCPRCAERCRPDAKVCWRCQWTYGVQL